MSTFAKFWLIIKSYKLPILIPLAIFIGLNVAVTIFMNASSDDEFQPLTDVNISIFDRDQTEITEQFIIYMSEVHNVIEIDDDQEAWLDGVSWGTHALVLEIPVGFTDGLLLASGDALLAYITDASSLDGFLVRGQIERYFSVMSLYIAGGFDPGMAANLTAENLGGGVEVELIRGEDEADLFGSYMFYRFMPMTLPAIVGVAVGGVYLALNKDDVRRRIESSPVSYKRRVVERILASIAFGMVAWGIYVAVSVVLYGSVMFETWGLIRMLNAIPLVFMGIALAYVVTLFIKKRDMLFTTIFSIAMALVMPAGVTFDIDMMNEQILAIGRFTPFYWYTRVNEMLTPMGYLDWTLLIQSLIIQLAYASAIIAVGMVFSKERRPD